MAGSTSWQDEPPNRQDWAILPARFLQENVVRNAIKRSWSLDAI